MQIFRCYPRRSHILFATLFVALLALPLAAKTAKSNFQPNFGANVYIFTPSMTVAEIQATVNSISATQTSNQFGTQRYALLFEARRPSRIQILR